MKKIVLLLFLFTQPSFAQKIISGVVKDAATGENLPAANIQIEGTLKGVIASREGKYSINVEHVPATLVVRYIGYESKKITITSSSAGEQDISLNQSPIEMEALVVLGEDPGMRIMRNVIAKKKSWHKKIQNFSADTYMRSVIENDSGIVMISEVLAETYWDRIRGLRSVIKSKRHTKNLSPSENVVVGDDEIVNLYDDDVLIQESKFVGPTHPDALDYYDFKIIGRRYRDDQLVYDISVQTKTKLQPTFVGQISVLDTDSVMIEAELRPNDFVIFPMPVQEWKVYYMQQFSNFGQAFWLPIDMRMDGKIKIGMIGLQFPSIKYTQITGFNNYQINVTLPDSLYKTKRAFIVDSTSLKKENQFDSTQIIIPLSDREDSAFRMIKRGDSFSKAFKPTGALSRMVKMEDEYNDSIVIAEKKKNVFKTVLDGLGPRFWFNRVDGAHVGIKYSYDFSKTFSAYVLSGYSTSLRRWFYGAGSRYNWGKKHQGFFESDYYIGTTERYPSDNYSLLVASGPALFGFRDYFDFYKNQKVEFGAGYEFRKIDLNFRIGWSSEIQTSLIKNTDFDILGRNNVQRPNPKIDEGTMRSVHMSVIYGDDYVPFGFVGQERAEVKIEHSSSQWLSSDFDFTTYRASVDWRFKTFFSRRFLPNVLDLRWIGGTYTGHLPLQRLSAIDGSLQAFTPFGVFKTLRGQLYEGEKYTAIFWEHNFRTIPFELIGLQSIAKKGIGVIVHGASGRTWISKDRLRTLTYRPGYTDQFHHEIGWSLNGLFGFFRIDTAQRLDKKGFYVGGSFARVF